MESSNCCQKTHLFWCGKIILSLGGGTSSIYAIWEGLNEYAAHLDEFGSQGWIDPK